MLEFVAKGLVMGVVGLVGRGRLRLAMIAMVDVRGSGGGLSGMFLLFEGVIIACEAGQVCY